MCWETAALNSREDTEASLCSTPKSSAGPTEISKVGDAEGSRDRSPSGNVHWCEPWLTNLQFEFVDRDTAVIRAERVGRL